MQRATAPDEFTRLTAVTWVRIRTCFAACFVYIDAFILYMHCLAGLVGIVICYTFFAACFVCIDVIICIV